MSLPHTGRGRSLLVLAGALVFALGLLFVGGAAMSFAQEDSPAAPFARRFPAPSLDGGVEWVNTAGPIDLPQLRGKFVILDFWTYCCINCMHILPELKKLEHAYPDEIVVIGVHSAKFATEEDSKNIREAIERYEIEHPVVNDAKHAIWRKYEVQSWPTLCVIDPEGNLVARNSGEIEFADLDAFFKKVLPYYRAKKLMKPSPPPLTGVAAGHPEPDTALRYPGKILADEKTNRLYISDSNHNRIVIAQLDGTLIETIGSGEIGAADGPYAKASFDHPQGLALDRDTLYVADTENHLLRKVDLKKKEVSTIAGVGRQARPQVTEFFEGGGPGKLAGRPLKTPLNSPWDVLVHGRELYIAMAGPHQIWRMALPRGEIGPFAGNGREDIVDGPHLPATPYAMGASSFAQPSGLSTDGTYLFVADSEGSSIRAVPFDTSQPVQTVVGTAWAPNGRLFLFGDVDGQGQQVRLQHALCVKWHDGQIYVADTYNNKIKIVDPLRGSSATLVGTGEAGKADDPPQFDEPAGLAYAKGLLYVADTNNHAVRTVNLKTKEVKTLEIAGLAPPAKPEAPSKPSFPGAQEVAISTTALKAVDGKVRLAVDLALPEGYKINPIAPLRYLVESEDAEGAIRGEPLGKLTKVEPPAAQFDIELSATASTEPTTLKVSLAYYYCQEGAEGLCKAGSVIWTVPVTISAESGEEAARLPLEVTE